MIQSIPENEQAILYMAWKKWSTARTDYNGELSVKSAMKISQFLVVISPVLGNSGLYVWFHHINVNFKHK